MPWKKQKPISIRRDVVEAVTRCFMKSWICVNDVEQSTEGIGMSTSHDPSYTMTAEEQIAKMKRAINQAIKVMGDRFGSTETDVAKAIEELKISIQANDATTTPLP